jgi:hypothetical protein
MGGIGKGGVFNAFQGVGGQSSNDSALLAFMQQMAAREAAAQAAALKAQQEAAGNAQANSAQQMAAQGSNAAAQYAAQQGQVQAAKDSAAAQAAAASASGAGNAVLGGGFNLNNAKQQALSNLGAAAGSLPTNAYNAAATNASMNPAATTAGQVAAANKTASGANQFSMPSMSGITFGGQ